MHNEFIYIMTSIERQYQRKMEAALRKGDFQLFESIRRQYDIYANSTERITAKDITDSMTDAERRKCTSLLRKIPVFADLCESACVDLQEMLRRYESSATLPILTEIKQMNNIAKNVRELINNVNDLQFAASFGDTCDKINELIDNFFTDAEKTTIRNTNHAS